MSVPVLHETEAEELDLPGRHLRWLVAGIALKRRIAPPA